MSSSTLSLADALLSYEQRNLDWSERLRRLQLDFGMRMGKTALAKLNKQFRIGAIPKHNPEPKPNRISLICDELASQRYKHSSLVQKENDVKHSSLTADNNARHRRAQQPRPTPSLPEIFNSTNHDRWWYAQHADLRLELDELKAGFAVEMLKKHKLKSHDRKRRAFADLSRPTSENFSDTL